MSLAPKPGAVLFAKDVARLAQFYEALAGLARVSGDADHVVLEGEHHQLVVHGIPRRVAAQIEITTPPQLRDQATLKLCLPVPSIAAAREQAARLGGQVLPPRKAWEARGFRACDGHDPEGNVFQLREALG